MHHDVGMVADRVRLEDVVVAATHQIRPRHVGEKVVRNVEATDAVIEVDGARVRAHVAPQVVEPISHDPVAAVGPISPSVDRARVLRLLHHVVDVVLRNRVVVALEPDGLVRGVREL